jgi:uncharacterized protein involved in exopolysaccharide biosynthesis
VSLIDILLIFVRRKDLILRTTLVFAVLGGAFALLTPAEYRSEARVVRESQGEGGNLPGGFSAGALSGLGISLGGTGGGLTPAAYPSVLQSRAVRLAVAKDTFQFPDAERPMTYVEYANRPPSIWDRVMDYTVWLPWTATNAALSAMSSGSSATGTTRSGGQGTGLRDERTMTQRERRGAQAVKGMVSPTIESETGLMSVAVRAGDPQLAADLTRSFVDHLTTRVRELRTERVRERLEFVEQRFEEVERELEAAEERLAQFLERNQNPTTATLQFRRDRLQRQVSFKEQLYSDLQSKLTQTRLDLQRQQPVVTVVEKPVPPTDPSGPNRLLYFLVAVVLGGGCGVGLVLAQTFITNWAERSEEGREKVEELRASLIPDFVWKRWNGADAAEVSSPRRAGDSP